MSTFEPKLIRRDEMPIAGRSMALDLRSFQRAAPAEGESAPLATCDIVFTAGARVKRYDWYRERYFLEELVVEEGAIRLQRLQRGAPLLNTHSAWDLEDVLGVCEEPAIAGGQGSVRVTFSRRESVAGYVQDVDDGVIRNVSVGYARHKVEMVPPEEEGGLWVYRVIDWEPMEVSLVPIPADMDSQVVRSAGGQLKTPDGRELRTFPCEFIEVRAAGSSDSAHGGRTAGTRGTQGAAHFSHSGGNRMQQDNQQQTRREAITELCKRHGVAHLAAGMIQRNIAEDVAREEIIEIISRNDEAAGGHLNVSREGHQTSRSDERELIINTLVARMRGRVEGEVIRSIDCAGLAVRALRLSGQNISNSEGRDAVLRRALHTTGDFPNLLGTAVGRVLHQGYIEAPSALKLISRKVTLPDFRDKAGVRLGGASDLLKVNEHGEFKYGTVQDAGNSWKLSTYGRIIGLTRQALVNDDLDGFSQVLVKFGQAAARLEAEQLVNALTAPPQVDSADIFSAARKSILTGGGSGLSSTSLASAVTMLRQQRELGNVLVQQEPGFLVVPAALEQLARQLVAAINPTKAADVQPYRLDVLVEPRLDAASATAWYLVAKNQSSLEHGYLDGEEGVQTDTQVGFEIDGVAIKARLDFGCGWAGYVGWVKGVGA